MEALQSYIFENSTDFKEIHYMRLMELMLKAHKSINNIQQPVVYVRRTISEWENYRINQIIDSGNIFKEKIVTFEEWFGMKDELFLNPSSFIVKMQEITFLPHEEATGVTIIFPECLSNYERQKIHIYASQNGFITLTTGKNDNIPRLHVFLRIDNFLIIP